MADLRSLDGQLVAGRWRRGDGAGIAVVNPSDETVITTVTAAGEHDVEDAVGSAREALPVWAATGLGDRTAVVRAIADGMERLAGDFEDLIVAELGMPRTMTRRLQVDLSVADFRATADCAEERLFERRLGNSVVVDVPVGVVAAITPWNYPLHQIAAKLAAALVAGCTVVLKPSDVTPLNALLLARVLEGLELPPGVVNMVVGDAGVGGALAAHPDVDMVSFTGSPEAGASVAAAAGRHLARVALELGGKGAGIVLDDVSEQAMDRAVRRTVSSCFLNSGQTCSALTRLLVPRRRLAQAEETARAAADSFVCGPPDDPATRLGPLVSEQQRSRVLELIGASIADGARVVAGGPDRPGHCRSGYFVSGTVLSDVDPSMRVARQEVFGPVLAVIGYDDEDEAVDIANGTGYGLTAAVWAGDPVRAAATGRRVRAGQVDINGGAFNPVAPFGGFGRSGFGREYGPAGIDEFLTTQSLQY